MPNVIGPRFETGVAMTPTMKRRLRRYGIATVIAVAPLAILCAYVANLLVPTEPLPKPATFAYVPMASIENTNNTIGIADSDIYGLTLADGFTMDTDAMDKHLDEMQALGVNTIRVLVPWAGNEPVPPGTLPPEWEATFWARSDYLINEAAERGMGVLAVLNSTPFWGADTDEGGWGAGAAPDPVKFAEYAKTVAQRYGVKIAAYEVWNEPNAVPYWTPVPDPVAYTEVLKAVYTAIKDANGIVGADPGDPMVVAGVLGAVVNFGDLAMDPRQYLETMYANDAQGFFDALSFHPYQYTTKFSEGEYNPAEPWKADSPLEMLIAMRETMMINGDDALKIWATEYGLPTEGVNGVTQQQQADFIEDFLDAWDDLSYTGPAFIYTTVDRMDGTEDGSFGIFTKDAEGNWVPKLAAQVIKDAIAANQPEQPQTPNLAEAIAQALAHMYQQLVNAFAQSWVNMIAQALTNLFAGIFNPPATTAATALALPAETQAAVAEGTAAAAVSVDTSAAEETAAAGDAAAATDEVPAEEVPAAEPDVTEPEVTEAVTEELAEEVVTEAPAQESEVPADESEVPAEETETVTEETVTEETVVVESEEPATPEQESLSTEQATTEEPKTTGEPATTPGTRKETEDEADVAKKDADKKPENSSTKADGATTGGKHEAGNVTNGTSVNAIKDRLAKETAADAGAADASAAAA
jgi:polysaccharide biosynthesis protein PslG